MVQLVPPFVVLPTPPVVVAAKRVLPSGAISMPRMLVGESPELTELQLDPAFVLLPTPAEVAA